MTTYHDQAHDVFRAPYRQAILDACTLMGEDMDGSLPTWPPPPAFLVQCATGWRRDWDDCADKAARAADTLAAIAGICAAVNATMSPQQAIDTIQDLLDNT